MSKRKFSLVDRLRKAKVPAPVVRGEARKDSGFCFGEETAGQRPACWPMESESLGVHPDQVQEATEYARKMGVPTEFNENANPVFGGKEHKRAYCRLFGYHDKNGGYSDP